MNNFKYFTSLFKEEYLTIFAKITTNKEITTVHFPTGVPSLKNGFLAGNYLYFIVLRAYFVQMGSF